MRHRSLSLLALLTVLAATPAFAQKRALMISVAVRGSRVLRFRTAIENVSVSNPKIADVKVLNNRMLQVIGKAIGETQIVATEKRGTATIIGVSVGIATSGLATQFRSIFPGEDIFPHAVGERVVLTGEVSDPIVVARAGKLARSYVKSDAEVMNFLRVRGRQQVQLRVKIAEVSRSAMRELGVNAFQRGKIYAGGVVAPGVGLQQGLTPELSPNLQPGASLAAPDTDNKAPLPLIAGAVGNAFGLHFSAGGAFPLAIALSIMQGHGLAKVLSEPTLVAYSGQQASFLAGGEFPIPVPSGLGQTNIEFKKYGVQLTFTPTVLANRTVHLKVSVSVSEPDQASALVMAGVTVPALTSRHSETTVRMRSGHSLAIAGLLQDRLTAVSNRVPLLGDIPVIGMFFRQSSFERKERELVILVTPYLVRPLKAGEVPALPGEDEVSDPGAVAFFLLGAIDPEIHTKRGRPAGPVGYSE